MTFSTFLTFFAALPVFLDCPATCAEQRVETQLTELAAAVRSADYRGDREALARLDAQLAKLPDSSLDDYRAYWRAFACWRRALNGFNENPTPNDLVVDVEAAIGHFKEALAKHPNWIEAKLGLVGCSGNLIYLVGKDPEKRKAILDEYVPIGRTLQIDAPDNPRVLWIVGGLQLAAPPPTGGDPARAAVTMRKGIECAWRESLAGGRAPWEPAWGGAENLMNLAWLYSNSAMADKAAARAYAQGALTVEPDWHYVKDVLLPKIEAMPEPASAPSASK